MGSSWFYIFCAVVGISSVYVAFVASGILGQLNIMTRQGEAIESAQRLLRDIQTTLNSILESVDNMRSSDPTAYLDLKLDLILKSILAPIEWELNSIKSNTGNFNCTLISHLSSIEGWLHSIWSEVTAERVEFKRTLDSIESSLTSIKNKLAGIAER